MTTTADEILIKEDDERKLLDNPYYEGKVDRRPFSETKEIDIVRENLFIEGVSPCGSSQGRLPTERLPVTSSYFQPEVPYQPIITPDNDEDITTQQRSAKIYKDYITLEGFGYQHIAVYDNWLKNSAQMNIIGRILEYKDGRQIRFENLFIEPPKYTRNALPYNLTPKYARENSLTYGCNWYVDAVLYDRDGLVLKRKDRVLIGQVPTMLKSKYCYLRGRSEAELTLFGEDPNDPGGYFIIKGVEKVVLGQEMLTVNKLFNMMMDNKGNIVTRMIASTPRGTVKIELAFDTTTCSIIEIQFPSIKIPVDRQAKTKAKYESMNVLNVFRLLGLIYNIENLNTQKGIEDIIKLFMKPDHIKKSLLKLARNWADFHMSKDDISDMMIKMGKVGLSMEEKRAEIIRVLETDLFPHMNKFPGPPEEDVESREKRVIWAKIYMLAKMLAQFLEQMAGYRKLDDRDSWSNKRVEGAGRMMEQLLRNAWRQTLGKVQGHMDKPGVDNEFYHIIDLIDSSIITNSFHDSFITSNWGVKGVGSVMKKNIAQTLVRDSVAATLTHINTVDVAIDRTDRQDSLRKVQNSQYGFICAVTSAEGDNCGLVKALASTARVSLEISDLRIIRVCFGETGRLESLVNIHPPGPLNPDKLDKIIVNGKFLGWCHAQQTYRCLIEKRRNGELDTDMSVIREDDWIYVDIGPSRLLRPLLIVNPDQTLAIDSKGLRGSPSTILLQEGAMEYVSSWEQEYIKLASSVDDISKRLDLIKSAEEAYLEAATNFDLIQNDYPVYIDENDGSRPLTEEEVQNYVNECKDQLKDIQNGFTVLVNVDEGEIPLTLENAEMRYKNALADLDAIQRKEVLLVPINPRRIRMTLDEARSRLESAMNEREKLSRNRPYTHCELDPQATLSITATLIPWPNHNQAPRNTYQVNMAKQALGIYHTNHANRLDGKMKILTFPNRPQVETGTYEVVGLDKRGPGENVIIAFMLWPYTEEDSFTFKESFLNNGGFRIFKYLTYKAIIKSGGDVEERLTRPTPRPGEPEGRYDYIVKEGAGAGLPLIGAPLRQGDCVIGKTQKILATGESRPESIIMRVGDEGIVDRIQVTFDQKVKIVTVKLRVMRVPEAGDKFAPRNAQKGTIGKVQPDIEMPFSVKSGLIPDIIVNCHCFTADTPILLKNGLSKPLVDMKYDGGDKIWSWDKDKHGFIQGEGSGYESQGIQSIIRMTLSDGRQLRCTPNHSFPVVEIINGKRIYSKVEAQHITENMFVLAGIDGVLDAPTDEERQIEKAWKLETKHFDFSMKTNDERERSMAFARLVGMICADGCVGCYKGRIVSNITTGSKIDLDMIMEDIELVSNQFVKYQINETDWGRTFQIVLPQTLAISVASLDGMTIGRRSTQTPEWPQFVFNPSCPKSIIREFIGGLFGGDGWSPYLQTNNQDGQGTVTFNPPAISMSTTVDRGNEMVEKMKQLSKLLELVGVIGARVDKPKKYLSKNDKPMVTCCLQLPRGTAFGDKVGFRYCVQKMYRLAAYQSYSRYLENVKRQNDYLMQRASEIFDNKEVGKSLMRALEKAREELFTKEKPLNSYYSYGTLDQVRNRRRKDRFNELKSWDYEFIEDADKYLRQIDAYHWFRTAEGTGGADYIIKQDDNIMPNFLLKVVDLRSAGEEEVFDFGVKYIHTFTSNGIPCFNSLPSRMTMSYIMELIAAKHGGMRGKRVNGGAFQPFDLDTYRETMKQYGMDEFGYEQLRSGNSGKLIDTHIFMGPVYFQALRHHVKDKAQSRSQGSVKPMTRQPPRGRGNRGGLRFGEMERDAGISHGASSFLLERLKKVSDEYITVFCKKCGTFAFNNTNAGYYECKLCRINSSMPQYKDNFGRASIPYAYKLLIHLLAPIGINLRPEFITNEEYYNRITQPRDIGSIDDQDIDDALEYERVEQELEIDGKISTLDEEYLE